MAAVAEGNERSKKRSGYKQRNQMKMESDEKIRRLESRLYTSGVGTILFSLWASLREIEIFFTTLNELPGLENEFFDRRTIYMILGILIGTVVTVSACIQIYIGRKAMLTSQRRYNGNAFIVIAGLLLLLSVAGNLKDLLSLSFFQSFRGDQIVIYVIDFTANIIMGEVMVFAILLKRARKRICR